MVWGGSGCGIKRTKCHGHINCWQEWKTVISFLFAVLTLLMVVASIYWCNLTVRMYMDSSKRVVFSYIPLVIVLYFCYDCLCSSSRMVLLKGFDESGFVWFVLSYLSLSNAHNCIDNMHFLWRFSRFLSRYYVQVYQLWKSKGSWVIRKSPCSTSFLLGWFKPAGKLNLWVSHICQLFSSILIL